MEVHGKGVFLYVIKREIIIYNIIYLIHKIIKNIKTILQNKKQLVIIEFGDNNQFVFLTPNNIRQNTDISLKRFEIQSNLIKDEQHILIGSFICPEYYKKGESLPDGTKVLTDDKILKWINLGYSENIEKMHESFENSIGYCDGNDYSDSYDDGPGAYGCSSWEEMAFAFAFDGDIDAWNHYNQ